MGGNPKIFLARSWGKDFASRIKREQFRVHSVFRRVCNLQSDPYKPLLSLVTEKEAMGPNSLLVDFDRFDNHIQEGIPVTFAASKLDCGSVMVNCSHTQDWRFHRTDYDFGVAELNKLLSWVENIIPGFISTKSQSTQRLIEGLINKDLSLLMNSLNEFIGRGDGLTPAGDDFVAGVLAAYVRGSREMSENHAFIESMQFLIKEKWPLTNAISQTMLWYASRGEGAGYITEMIDAIYSSSKKVLNLAHRLWHIGASSGRYLLAGIFWGCQIVLVGRK